MKVFQIGSSVDNPILANDLDLIIVSDKPVDICVYTETAWKDFQSHGLSSAGHRIVVHPPKQKGDKLTKIKELL